MNKDKINDDLKHYIALRLHISLHLYLLYIYYPQIILRQNLFYVVIKHIIFSYTVLLCGRK